MGPLIISMRLSEQGWRPRRAGRAGRTFAAPEAAGAPAAAAGRVGARKVGRGASSSSSDDDSSSEDVSAVGCRRGQSRLRISGVLIETDG
jgi:hypothetical protein